MGFVSVDPNASLPSTGCGKFELVLGVVVLGAAIAICSSVDGTVWLTIGLVLLIIFAFWLVVTLLGKLVDRIRYG